MNPLLPTLRYQAARLGLGTLDPEDVKSTIEALVDSGLFLQPFTDALVLSRPRLDEVAPGFVAALAHHGIAVPDQHTAVLQLIEHHLRNAVRPGADPLEHLARLIDEVYHQYDFASVTREFLGDSHGIERLIGLHWGIDDMRERPEISCNGKTGDEAWPEVRQLIAVEAERWLSEWPARV